MAHLGWGMVYPSFEGIRHGSWWSWVKGACKGCSSCLLRPVDWYRAHCILQELASYRQTMLLICTVNKIKMSSPFHTLTPLVRHLPHLPHPIRRCNTTLHLPKPETLTMATLAGALTPTSQSHHQYSASAPSSPKALPHPQHPPH